MDWMAIAALVLVASACSPRRQQTPAGSVHGRSSEEKPHLIVPGGPTADACRLGDGASNVQSVGLIRLLADAHEYYGKKVQVRGYFVLAMDNISLLEPTKREQSIMVDVRQLPATDARQLIACRLKLVDVQGYVTHVPSRGGERVTIIANTMTAPSDQ